MNCPLCNAQSKVFYDYKDRLYHQCNNCKGIFVDKSLLLDKEKEKQRYEYHNNNVEDTNYQKFVSPITNAILSNFSQTSNGLDFGAGTGPVISKVLHENNFNIVQYDPFFHNYKELLGQKYDYIACCEVIEHFYTPKEEFILMQKLLQKSGKLYCMTDIYNESIDFHKWYYKNDNTHVFIYHKNTFQWIKENIGFSDVQIEERLITFYQ